MTWLRSADAALVSAIEVARICLVLLGCVAAGWAVGFGMGYRRGVKAGMSGDIVKAEHRINAE
jgi:hypothetical protein